MEYLKDLLPELVRLVATVSERKTAYVFIKHRPLLVPTTWRAIFGNDLDRKKQYSGTSLALPEQC